MKLTYLGHSAFFIEGKHNIIIDPFITGNPSCSIDLEDFKKIDYILITHGHADHFGDSIKLSKMYDAKIICNFEIGHYLTKNGIDNYHPMHIGGSYTFDFGYLKMTTALHGSSIFEGNEVIYAGNPCGFLFELDNIKFYHAGDTGLTLDMQLLKEYNIDYAMIPIGGNFVMDVNDALKSLDFIKPKNVIPMHYNTWDIIKADENKFSIESNKKDINCKILKPNETINI